MEDDSESEISSRSDHSKKSKAVGKTVMVGKSDARREMKKNKKKKFRFPFRGNKDSEESDVCDDFSINCTRPLFSAQHVKLTQKMTRKNLPPREVIVPYSRMRKERFSYWPPYPYVSSASCSDNKDRKIISRPETYLDPDSEINSLDYDPLDYDKNDFLFTY